MERQNAKVLPLVVLKTQFYKNISKDGGAMREAITKSNYNEIIIHSQTKKQGRLWGHTTPSKLLKLVEKNNGIYEVITKFPHKVYFDIDGDETCDLSVVKTIILQYFPDAEMSVSGSQTNVKNSYHIVLNNYTIHNKEERDIVKHICIYINKYQNPHFDWKVYTNNRNMKAINQSKLNDPRIQLIIDNQDYRSHFITCFINQHSLPFPTLNQDIQEEVQITKSKSSFDITSIPKFILNEPDNFDFYTTPAIDILNMFPCGKQFAHNYTHLIARFCDSRNIPFTNFLSWIQQKHGNPLHQTIITKWKYHFDNLNKYPAPSDKQLLSILNNYYPNIMKDRFLKSFINTFNLNQNDVKKIETLTQACFNTNKKYEILNTGMGSGKTYQTIDFLKSQKTLSQIWICPNIALAENTLHRLNKKGIDFTYYQNFTKKQKTKGELNEDDKMCIVLNSLHYITRSYDVVVIDEIETLLNKFSSEFLDNDGKKQAIWNHFKSIIKNAKKVILLDAFTTQKTIKLINDIENNDNTEKNIYERIEEPITRDVEILKNDKIMIKQIIDCINNGGKPFIFYPYKKQTDTHYSMEQLKNIIELSTNTKDKCVFYNADVDDIVKKQLKNVNHNWNKVDAVILNNIITCGVNYEKHDFTDVFIFIASHNVPRDIIQVSYRIRNLTNNKIYMCFMGRMLQQTTYINDKMLIGCPIYERLLNNIFVELNSPIRKTIKYLCGKAKYNFKIDNTEITDKIIKYIDDLYNECQVCFSYDNIDNIEDERASQIQQALLGQIATMQEKIELQKYFFKMNFNYDCYDLTYQFIEGEEDNVLEYLWELNYSTFIKKYTYILEDEENIFNKIKKFNVWGNVFDIDFRKSKLNDDLKDEIFNQFAFKYVGKQSNVMKILKEIYNAYFGRFIIETSVDANKNISYKMDIDTYKFIGEFIKKHKK